MKIISNDTVLIYRGMPILSVVDEQHPDAYDNAFGMEKQCVMVKQVHQQEKRMLPL